MSRFRFFIWSALNDAVHRTSCNFEQFCDLGDGVLSRPVQGYEVGCLVLAEFGHFAAKPALGLGDLHSLTRSGADEVRFELGDHGQDIEQQSADRIIRIVN